MMQWNGILQLYKKNLISSKFQVSKIFMFLKEVSYKHVGCIYLFSKIVK